MYYIGVLCGHDDCRSIVRISFFCFWLH